MVKNLSQNSQHIQKNIMIGFLSIVKFLYQK